MNWSFITSEQQLDTIREESNTRPIVIFKHSTRCSISLMAKMRLERAPSPADTTFYCLDLLKHRAVSNKIAEDFSVYHESPQMLIIRNGECIYDESRNGISMEDIAAGLSAN
jgi:bacillithiol system protein YtxJ